MTSLMLVIAATAFLSGAAAAVFLMIVIGIRKADRPRRQSGTQNTPLDVATRTMLGTGTWPNGRALGDHEAD
jgi:hypothetical protein